MTEQLRTRMLSELVLLAGWVAIIWWGNRLGRLEFDRQVGQLRALMEAERLEELYRDS